LNLEAKEFRSAEVTGVQTIVLLALSLNLEL
jgi:hypothetical protein